MTANDLRHLLADLAADGSIEVNLDEERLLPRIRARRRRRVVLTGAVSAAAVVVVAAGAYAVQAGEGNQSPPVAVTPPTADASPGALMCGSTAAGLGPATDSPLVLAMDQQVATREANGETALIATQLTNASSKTMELTTARSIQLVVVRDGVVVAEALPLRSSAVPHTLRAGQTATFQSAMGIRDCGSGEPLPSGRYQLYGVLEFAVGDPQTAAHWEELREGPWTIELR